MCMNSTCARHIMLTLYLQIYFAQGCTEPTRVSLLHRIAIIDCANVCLQVIDFCGHH